MGIFSDPHDISFKVIKEYAGYLCFGRPFCLGLGTKGFDCLVVTIDKGPNLVAFYVMGLKHPDSIGHGHAHQEVSVTNILDFRADNLGFQFHVILDICRQAI